MTMSRHNRHRHRDIIISSIKQRKCCVRNSIVTVYVIYLSVTCAIRECGAFHLTTREDNRYHRPWLRLLSPSFTSNVADVAMSMSSSKFGGIMAANSDVSLKQSSAAKHGFEALTWTDDYDSMSGNNERCKTAVLPDDELPPNIIGAPPSLHNKRTLYYQQSLLSKDEAAALQNAAERSGKLLEFDSRLAGIIEDGVDVVVTDDTNNGAPSLASILRPILTSKIIPWARAVSSTPTLTVADALIRSYDPSKECQHLSEHYDESSFATVIVPLNDPNEYEGGLYVQSGASSNTRRGVPFSNAGDIVLHKYDVMHGVTVRSGKKRCSLVIWFGEDEASVQSKTVPWVIREAKSSVHAAFLFAYNSQNGLFGFTRDLEIAKQYYYWASQRGHALSAYNLWLIEEEESRRQNEFDINHA